MIKTNISLYAEFAGTTQTWSGTDNYNRWIQNSSDPKKKEVLDQIGWTADSITYRFNKQGFRSDDFTGEGVMFLGCSNTMGIGMDLERTWAYIVAKEIGLKCWNLGIGGASPDTAFRNAQEWIPQLKPKVVFMLEPPRGRFEILTYDGPVNFIYLHWKEDEFYLRWAGHPRNNDLNYLKNRYAIMYVCQQHNIPFVFMSDQELFDVFHSIKDPHDLARDLRHRGHATNARVAELMLEQYRNIT